MSFFPAIVRRAEYTGEPKVYTYRRYKSEIAEDCAHRCVYCDCHCNSLGGHVLMELDHFRPKADHQFPELKNEPTNLVLACRSCNGKKRDDWPAGKATTETHLNGLGYIDPFQTSRPLFFEVEVSGKLLPIEAPAAYMIEQLALNRPFAAAIRARRLLRGALHAAITSLIAELQRMDQQTRQPGELKPILDLLAKANTELEQLEMEEGIIL
jgi:hypothetical protein